MEGVQNIGQIAWHCLAIEWAFSLIGIALMSRWKVAFGHHRFLQIAHIAVAHNRPELLGKISHLTRALFDNWHHRTELQGRWTARPARDAGEMSHQRAGTGAADSAQPLEPGAVTTDLVKID